MDSAGERANTRAVTPGNSEADQATQAAHVPADAEKAAAEAAKARAAQAEATKQQTVDWLRAASELEWSEAVLESSGDPQRSLRLAIEALKKAKTGTTGEQTAKLERFSLEVRDVLGRLAADEAMRSR